jgi:FkbM family methyltransferase
MNNVFLDLGTHYGQGLREFVERFRIDDSWIVYTFEANPNTYKIFTEQYLKLTPYVRPTNAAVSDHTGKITLNLETPPNEGDTGMGSSVVPLDVWDPWGNNSSGTHFLKQVDVLCFDFSKFVLENFSPEDNIIVKMDIEGSEYDVLEKMIRDDSISYLNHISVEWHSRFFKNKDEIENRERNLIETIRTYNGLNLESWK